MLISANYDEFLVMKYLIAKAALDGTTNIYPVSAVTDEASARGLIKAVKLMSNNFEILSTDYNTAGVYNSSAKEDQYLIIDNSNDANLSVDCLAYMFGPQFAQADAKKIRIDGFDKLDIPRLKKVLGLVDDPFTSDEITALGNIEGVLVDWAWFQIYYKLFETTFIQNPENLYENTWLHLWKIYSRSIFENCVIFASGTNTIAVAIDDSALPTVTHGVAGSGTIDAEVTITGLAQKGAGRVVWSVANGDGATGTATIDQTGKLSWNNAYTATDTIVVTCTSAIDSTKTDSVTITVA